MTGKKANEQNIHPDPSIIAATTETTISTTSIEFNTCLPVCLIPAAPFGLLLLDVVFHSTFTQRRQHREAYISIRNTLFV
jgi:hypothetical protein